MLEEVGHCERCGISRREWDMARDVVYGGGGGTLREVWYFQEGVRHGKRCCICRRRWDIAGHVDYAGGGGTL
jgi:hypothetical protein